MNQRHGFNICKMSRVSPMTIEGEGWAVSGSGAATAGGSAGAGVLDGGWRPSRV